MTPQRLAAIAAMCREFGLPALVIVWLVAFGSAGLIKTGASPVVARVAPSLAANAESAANRQPAAADKPQSVLAAAPFAVATDPAPAVPLGTPQAVLASANAEVALVEKPVATAAAEPATTATTVETTRAAPEEKPAVTEEKPVAPERKPVVVAALGDAAEVLPAETPPVQAAVTNAPAAATGDPKTSVGSVEILDECYVMETCVDRFLWTLYQRTPKEDSVKQSDRQQVTVKRKGKMVTVTRTVTRVVDEDFGWKDPKAADHVGMPMPEYVLGGMDKDFKMRLFRMLLAAEQAGLSPGITSAFRDDYRQSIASGLKAASDRSYHGGSSRGGYGHGLAADIVGIKGDTRAQRLLSSDALWNWVDKHGKDYGVGRPYHDRDPPHVGPIDGTEYVSRHGGKRTASVARRAVAPAQQASSAAKRQSNAKPAPPRRGDAT
jgi:hypothetical protein